MPLSPAGTALLDALVSLEGGAIERVDCGFAPQGHTSVVVQHRNDASAHAVLHAKRVTERFQKLFVDWRIACPIFDARPRLFPEADTCLFSTGVQFTWRKGILQQQTTTLPSYIPHNGGRKDAGGWRPHHVVTLMQATTLQRLLALLERPQGPFGCWSFSHAWPHSTAVLAGDLDTALLLLAFVEEPSSVLSSAQPVDTGRRHSVVEHHPAVEVDAQRMLGHLWS